MTVAIVALLAAFIGAIVGWLVRDHDDRHAADCPCGHHPVMHGRSGVSASCQSKGCPCQVDYHEALRLAGIVNPHRDAGS